MRDIVVAALVMHLIALSVPIFFQLLVDKVVPNQAFSTLYALSAGVGVLILFDAGFNYLRNYLLAFITRRLDHQVANSTIEHLLQLADRLSSTPTRPASPPTNCRKRTTSAISWRAGCSTRFSIFSRVIIYPAGAAALFLAADPDRAGVSAIAFIVLAAMSRTFRSRLTEVNEIEGRRKAFLFEILNGIATIKTLALEPRSMLRWRRYTDEAANKSLSLDHTAAGARSVVASLERGMSVGIGALGALFVLSDQMTVGALVAFNMLGLRLVQPLIHASSLMQDYQRSVLSLKLLAQLMQTAPEPSSGQLAPTIRGHIEFDSVTFHYPGIADAGGQGHLVRDRARPDRRHRRPQRLGQDDDHAADPGSLSAAGRPRQHRRPGSEGARSRASAHPDRRRPAGEFPVPRHGAREHRDDQAGRLARRGRAGRRSSPARTNSSSACRRAIRRCSRKAPTNLSGGQRQRLAIARALIHDPPVLIFDEATSSLDPESEAIIQQHLAAIARGRTIVIVTHRLSFVARADAIIVVDGGHLVQVGPHEALLGSCLPYKQLWSQQARMLSVSLTTVPPAAAAAMPAAAVERAGAACADRLRFPDRAAGAAKAPAGAVADGRPDCRRGDRACGAEGRHRRQRQRQDRHAATARS